MEVRHGAQGGRHAADGIDLAKRRVFVREKGGFLLRDGRKLSIFRYKTCKGRSHVYEDTAHIGYWRSKNLKLCQGALLQMRTATAGQ